MLCTPLPVSEGRLRGPVMALHWWFRHATAQCVTCKYVGKADDDVYIHLPDVLRLWDSLLSDSRRFEFLMYVAAMMVMSLRDEILEQNDFAFCVKKLQHFENHIPVHALLARPPVRRR